MDCSFPKDTSKQNRLTGFSSSFTLNGAYSSTLTFADPYRQDGQSCGQDCDPGVTSEACRELCDPVTVSLSSTISTNYCLADITTDPEGEEDLVNISKAFAAPPSSQWVAGLIRGYGRSISSAQTTYPVESYFEYLHSKPIGTQNFFNTPLSLILDTIFRYYSGTPSNLISLSSISNTMIKGPVEGNDILAELQLLAQAGLSNLFVQVGGKLTIEGWKDHNSITELKIPAQAIISAEPAQLSRANTTFIRARGGSVSKIQAGERVLSNKEDNPSPTSKIAISGIKTDRVVIKHNNLTGNEKDIQNSKEISSGVTAVGKKRDISAGNYTRTYKTDDGSSFGPEGKKLNILVTGKTQSKDSEAVFSKKSKVLNKGYSNTPSFNNTKAKILQGLFPVAYSAFGKGAFGSDSFNTNSNEDGEADSNSPIFEQAEAIAISPTISKCGVKHEDISNKYVVSKDILFQLALRRFQEIEMAANTWNVTTVFIPKIKLNQVVEFEVPNIYDNEVATTRKEKVKVRGVVGAINISSTVGKDGDEATMSLSISSLECLGKTLFTSSNLIESAFAGSNTGVLNGWITSAHGIQSTATVENGTITLFASPPEAGAIAVAHRPDAKASFTQNQLQPNSDYYWEVEYETIQGTKPVELRFPGDPSGTGLTTLNGSGTYSGYFGTGVHRTSATWDFHMAPPEDATYFRVKNFKLVRKVYA
tara:strand:- start:14893 stop:17004 length:2112 start_codon:yes stop_codon:yes gene_type:complete